MVNGQEDMSSGARFKVLARPEESVYATMFVLDQTVQPHKGEDEGHSQEQYLGQTVGEVHT